MQAVNVVGARCASVAEKHILGIAGRAANSADGVAIFIVIVIFIFIFIVIVDNEVPEGAWRRRCRRSSRAATPASRLIRRGVRERIWGRPRGVREASWEVLGLSGGVRGASWEGLGRSWGDLGVTLEAVRLRIVFLIDFERQKGAQREAFWEPKWSQNLSENDSKSKSIFKSEHIPFKTVLEPSSSRLGPILGHLDWAWGHLGAILGRLGEPKPLFFLRIFTIFEKSRFYIKKVILAGLEPILGRLEAILEPLGPNLARFGRPRGPKREAKRDPRGAKNEPKMTSIFWSIFGPILDRFGRPRKLASSSGAECAGPG